MSKIRYKFFLTLLAGVAIGVGGVSAADEPTPAAPPPVGPTEEATTEEATTEGAPLVVTGKIVVVDKTAGTITLEVEGKLRLLKVGRNVKMLNDGKPITLAQLAAGQEIAVLTRVGKGKALEVVALSVKPSKTAATAAGAESGGGTFSAPFTTVVNPANQVGPIISPAE